MDEEARSALVAAENIVHEAEQDVIFAYEEYVAAREARDLARRDRDDAIAAARLDGFGEDELTELAPSAAPTPPSGLRSSWDVVFNGGERDAHDPGRYLRWCQAADNITRDIVEGRYRFDRPLPPQADLAKELNTTTGTVGHALRELRSQDIVRQGPARRTYIHPNVATMIRAKNGLPQATGDTTDAAGADEVHTLGATQHHTGRDAPTQLPQKEAHDGRG